MAQFQTINKETKRAAAILNAYESAWKETLADAYPSHYSAAKARAFKGCKEIMEAFQGYGMRITGANTSQFSCACRAVVDGESGLIYFTAARNYFIPLSETRKPITSAEFGKRWKENVTDDIKERTARALDGHIVTSEEEAEGILKAAEMFSAMQRLFAK